MQAVLEAYMSPDLDDVRRDRLSTLRHFRTIHENSRMTAGGAFLRDSYISGLTRMASLWDVLNDTSGWRSGLLHRLLITDVLFERAQAASTNPELRGFYEGSVTRLRSYIRNIVARSDPAHAKRILSQMDLQRVLGRMLGMS